jgi:membrane dipeptidase
MNDTPLAEPAAAFYRESLVWDMVFPLEPWCGNDLDALARHRQAGFHHVSLTVAGDNHNIGEAVQRIGAARREILARDELMLIESLDDLETARTSNRLAITLHCEGSRCFERNLDMVETFRALGIRHNLLAFNQTNSAGGGCAEKFDGGISNFGRSLVQEMQRVGMLVDLSHTGQRTSLDALELATRPMVFTHSMAAAVHPHFRNLSDEQIKACAASGGVIGMSSCSEYMGDAACANEALFRHIDHIAELVGADHIGLGLDFVFDPAALNAWIRTRPEEWPGTDSPDWAGFAYAVPEQIPALAGLLLDKGYPASAVRGILGGNWLRVCGAAW